MNTIYDILRHLVEHTRWPVDELKQEAHDLLNRLENFAAEHAGVAPENVVQNPATVPTDPAADQQTTMSGKAGK